MLLCYKLYQQPFTIYVPFQYLCPELNGRLAIWNQRVYFCVRPKFEAAAAVPGAWEMQVNTHICENPYTLFPNTLLLAKQAQAIRGHSPKKSPFSHPIILPLIIRFIEIEKR